MCIHHDEIDIALGGVLNCSFVGNPSHIRDEFDIGVRGRGFNLSVDSFTGVPPDVSGRIVDSGSRNVSPLSSVLMTNSA